MKGDRLQAPKLHKPGDITWVAFPENRRRTDEIFQVFSLARGHLSCVNSVHRLFKRAASNCVFILTSFQQCL